MSALGALSGTLASIFGIVALVAAALAALQYGTLKTVRESNEDLRAQHKDDVERMATKDLDYAKVNQELTEERGKVAILTEINTQQVSWAAVTDQLAHHHERAEKHWARDENRSAHMEQLLERIADKDSA